MAFLVRRETPSQQWSTLLVVPSRISSSYQPRMTKSQISKSFRSYCDRSYSLYRRSTIKTSSISTSNVTRFPQMKAANILISANGQIKLSYFSPDRQFTDTLFKSKSHFLSLPYWLPPETIEKSAFDQKGDIWALGITAFELITGKLPYENIPVQKVIFHIVQDPPPRLTGKFNRYYYDHKPRDLQDFVERCLQKDPKNRPTAKDLLQHPSIAQAKKTQLLFELFEKQTTIKLSLKKPKQQANLLETTKNRVHKRVRTSFRVNSMGLLVAEGSQTITESRSPDRNQDNSLIQEEEADSCENLKGEQRTFFSFNESSSQSILAMKRTIRKIEKFKPGLTKQILDEIVFGYQEQDPSDFKVYFK